MTKAGLSVATMFALALLAGEFIALGALFFTVTITTGTAGTIKYVFSRSDGAIAASSSTERISLIVGKYVGKEDPVMIVRAQQNFPAVGEVLEPFRYPSIIGGWMRGSHYGPLMPVSVKQGTPTRREMPTGSPTC